MDYQLIRSRRKTVAIQITRQGVVVRAPLYMSAGEIRAFVQSKQAWIDRALAAQMSSQPALSADALRELTRQAAQTLPARVAHYASLLQVSYGRVAIRHQKTRWGSCSGKGNLNFNCLLMLAPTQVQDYVVVHELCHRLEMNHSPRFWALVEGVLPEYQKYRRWLKEEGRSLIARLPVY